MGVPVQKDWLNDNTKHNQTLFLIFKEHNAEANFKYKDYYTAVSRHNLKGGVPGCFRGRNGVRQEWFHHHHPTFMPNGNRQKSSPDQPQETLLMGTLFSAYEHINCVQRPRLNHLTDKYTTTPTRF